MLLKLRSLVASLIILLGPACPSIRAESVSDQALRIGVVIPLTGGLAEYGEAARNGIVLAQREHPEQLSSVQFVYEDSRYDNTAAIAAVTKLRSVNDVEANYVWGYAPAGAAAPVAERMNFPLFACSSDPSIERDRKFVVRFATSIERHSEQLVQHFRDRGFKKIGIVAAEIPFFTGMIDGIKARLQPGESVETVETVQPSQMDFKSSVLRVRAAKFDAVGVFLIGGQIAQFYRNGAALGLKTPTFGTDFFDSEAEVAAAMPLISGAVFPAPSFDPNFQQRYREAFQTTAQLPYAANAYDFALLVGRFAKARRAGSSASIVDFFRQGQSTTGASGKFNYLGAGEFSPGFDFTVVLKQVDAEGRIVMHARSGSTSK